MAKLRAQRISRSKSIGNPFEINEEEEQIKETVKEPLDYFEMNAIKN